MSIEVALLLSLVSVVFSVYFGLKNNRRSDSKEIEAKAAETAVINVKLDQIGSDVRDIKYDITSVKNDVQQLTGRMIKVEESAKQAHHRIDELSEKA